MSKKSGQTNERAPRTDTRGRDEEPLDIPTLLWALGILAVLVILQRLIWGE
ncbi:MAG: hypothetical protein ACKVU1_08385 [bacterium]